MSDRGLTHVALPVADVDASVRFYERYAGMRPVHRRRDPTVGNAVVWLSDGMRPFVIVLVELPPHATLPTLGPASGSAISPSVNWIPDA